MTASIVDLGEALRARRVSSLDLVREANARISTGNPRLNAFLCLAGDVALDRARALDAELASGRDRGPLHGIPVAVKDNFWTKGLRTTSGSKIFADFVPEVNAAAVDRLESAGAVVVGKTNLHELAYGITSNNPHYGAVHNPHDLERIPGGSSGGSGAAVAAGIVPAALGSDTGGSIRIPASFCGCVGLKPTYGLVSTYGCQPLGLTLDHVGPLTMTVRDAGLVLQALCGIEPPAYGPIGDLRLGIPENFYFDHTGPQVAEAVRAAAQRSGAIILPVRVPDVAALNLSLRTMLLCEAASIYQEWLDRPDLFGADVFALLDQGLQVPGTAYVKAQQVLDSYRTEFARLFESIDCLVTPTTPTTAPRIGETTIRIGDHEMDVRIAATSLVRAVNGLGYPAISVPCGCSGSGLPIGLQLVARPHQDALLLRAAAAIELNRP